MASFHLLLVLIFIMNGDLAVDGFNHYIDRLRERRPSLNVMIADEPEMAALGKDGGFVVD